MHLDSMGTGTTTASVPASQQCKMYRVTYESQEDCRVLPETRTKTSAISVNQKCSYNGSLGMIGWVAGVDSIHVH